MEFKVCFVCGKATWHDVIAILLVDSLPVRSRCLILYSLPDSSHPWLSTSVRIEWDIKPLLNYSQENETSNRMTVTVDNENLYCQ